MGLKLTVNKEDNSLYADFIDAYWRVDNIVFSNANGESYVSFELNTYPSRESASMNLQPITTNTFPVGGATAIAYNTKIRTWLATFKTNEVFTGSIPLSEAEQKDIIYPFIKAYTGITDWVDVLEEEN